MAKAGSVEMRENRREKSFARGAFGFVGITAHAYPRFNEWPDKPRPDCALMIRAVALENTARVVWRIGSFPLGQRAQPERRTKFLFDELHNAFGTQAFKQRKR